jgi:PAS domain S-box-containing protein
MGAQPRGAADFDQNVGADMNLLDMRTIVFSYVVTNIICVWFVVLLWRQSRDRFAGIAFLVIDFIFQAAALILIVLRGAVPDWISMVLSNTLVITGAILGFMGLERFVGKKGPQIHNYLLVTLFTFIHGYFVFVQPSLAVRNLNIAAALLLVCVQSVWLMWRRVEPGLRSLTFGVGLVNFLYCLVSVIRILQFFFGAHAENNYFHSGLFEALVLVSYQVLFLMLTYNLVLMVNKRLLMQIGTQEEKFAKAFHSAPYAITLTRPSDGRIVEVNETFFSITGYDRTEVMGKNTVDLRLWEHDQDRAAAVDALLKTGKVHGKEFSFRKKNGEAITGLFSAEIITIDGEKNILSSIGDITARKQAEEAVRRLNEELESRVLQRTAQLEASNREVESFSYSVSHDLRSPLRSIDGFSQALYEEYGDKLNDTGKGYLDRVRKATQKMGLLIDDLLKLLKVTRSEIQPESIDLSSMVRGIAEAKQKNNPDRVVEATVQEGIVVQGDPHLIRIALMNLLDNAWKFTVNASHPRIEFGAVAKDGETCYFIRDNGVGFDMAYADKMFGAFQRLHTPEEFAGTGIGLATVQRIIHRHRGRVWAEGEVGKGATFYFTLPL